MSIGALGWLQLGGSFLQMMGQQEGGRAARIEGEQRRAAAEFEAWQAEELAGQVMASAQRQALEEKRKARFDASRAIAVAAASGAGVSDPTIVNLIASAKGEGVYRAHVALYEGEAKARQLKFDAATGRLSGTQALMSGLRKEEGAALASMGTLVKGGASLYSKYGLGGPGKAAVNTDSFFADADLSIG